MDLKAKSTIEICNRIQHYLRLENIFPWKYNVSKYKVNKKICYYINELFMIEDELNNNPNNNIIKENYIKIILKMMLLNVY